MEQNGFRAFVVLARPFTLLAPAVGFLAGSAMATGGEIPTAGLVGTLAVTILNAGSNIINQ
ncbi:MAG: hypothetical protein OXI23_21540, partial [Gemmatimonadota bacterium]|nr:hypothetical protein [Gemmatimonadota bacterium]